MHDALGDNNERCRVCGRLLGPGRFGRKYCSKACHVAFFADDRRRRYEANKHIYAQNAKEKYALDPSRRMLSDAKRRAKRSGIEFSITIEDLPCMPDVCPVLGIGIFAGGDRNTSPSLDRIDNRLGYIRGNVAWISCRANRLKNDGTLSEHEMIYAYQATTPSMPTHDHCEWRSAKMVNESRCRAKRKGVVHTLSRPDVLTPSVCPVFGGPLSFERGPVNDWTPTLDRILPDVGYVPGNVLVVSYRANRIKNNGTLDERAKLVNWLVANAQLELVA